MQESHVVAEIFSGGCLISCHTFTISREPGGPSPLFDLAVVHVHVQVYGHGHDAHVGTNIFRFREVGKSKTWVFSFFIDFRLFVFCCISRLCLVSVNLSKT